MLGVSIDLLWFNYIVTQLHSLHFNLRLMCSNKNLQFGTFDMFIVSLLPMGSLFIRCQFLQKKLDYPCICVLTNTLRKWLVPSSTARKVGSFLACTCSGVAIHRKFTDYTHSKRMLVETRITFTVPSVSILNPGLE